jgi:hypothetical protein
MPTTRSRIASPSPIQQAKAVRDWNSSYQPGQAVEVTADYGRLKETVTISEAWMLGGHTAVVMLAGVVGCYNLKRVRALPPKS